jgi:hypothetical protein
MNTIGEERTISIDDLRRNFGEIKKSLPRITFIITDRGNPIGRLTATREIKKTLMKSTIGAFKGTELDNDELWNDVLRKHSRKEDITL